jgi:hypothetical protein
MDFTELLANTDAADVVHCLLQPKVADVHVLLKNDFIFFDMLHA